MTSIAASWLMSEMAIAATASAIVAVCNLVAIVLHHMWLRDHISAENEKRS